MSAAIHFWQLLQCAEEEGLSVPQGSSHITVDASLCGVLAREMGAPPEQFYLALHGLPVKQVYCWREWALKVEPEHPERALVNAAAKAKERKGKARGIPFGQDGDGSGAAVA